MAGNDPSSEMAPVRSRPMMLFRLALREQDWRLAARLAALLGAERCERERMERELALAALNVGERPVSLSALRALDRLARLLGLRRASLGS
jgi:hypothetical protein